MSRAEFSVIDTRTPDLYRTVSEAALELRAERAAARVLDEARSPRFGYRITQRKKGRVYTAIV